MIPLRKKNTGVRIGEGVEDGGMGVGVCEGFK